MHGIADIVLQHLATYCRIARLTAIGIEEVGIVEVGLELAHETIVLIDASLVGCRDRAFVASRPLTKHTRGIAIVLHNLGKDDMGCIIRFLTCLYGVFVIAILHATNAIFLIATHPGMSGMLTRHERRTRWGTDRATRIGLSEAHALTCHTVEVRGMNTLLSIAADIGIAQVIAHDIDDIRAIV